MKKKLLCACALIVALTVSAALAEGRIDISRENYCLNDDGDRAYVFAKVENNGDAPIRVADSHFELLDAEGKALADTETMKEYADYLQPGEYTYVSADIDLKDVEGTIADHSLSIKGKDGDKYTSVRLDTEWALDPDDREAVLLTVTNNTGDVLYGVKGAVCFLNGEDIVALNSVSMLSKVGINPGSSVTMKVEAPTDLKDAVKAVGMENLTFDAVACANVKN